MTVNSMAAIFSDYIANLISSKKQMIYIFKGFTITQIEYLIYHPYSILSSNNIIKNHSIDLLYLDDHFLDIFNAIKSAQGPLFGFYEELMVICDLLPRLKTTQIVVIENNLFSPWVPSCIPYDQVIDFFDHLQSEREPKTELLRLLTQVYADVKLLNGEKALLLPLSLTDDNITTEPFWPEELKSRSKVNCCSENREKIELGSQRDWEYRLNLLCGIDSPACFQYHNDYDQVRQSTLAAILQHLNVDAYVEKFEAARQEYSDTQFLPLLKKYWGENASFRMLSFYKEPDRSNDIEVISQGQIISEIIDQCELALDGESFNNIFITAPTGSGKSILFQIPALHLADKYGLITIVISPLIALMNDQVDQLQEKGISLAACINSSVTIEERLQVIDRIGTGRISLLYLAPELLLTTNLQTFLGGRKVGLMVVDEAHTVVGWGRDFRSDYWFLGDFLRKVKRDGLSFPVLCLTATAVYSGEEDVVNDTINELALEKTIIHLGNVKRNNISFDICLHDKEQIHGKMEDVKMQLTLERMRKYICAEEKVLTYFPYRSHVDNAHSQILPQERVKIRRYHGQLPAPERRMAEKSYKSGEALGLLSTKAFGMGVDVSDITHVIHFAPTGTLSDYVQEIGRVARDPSIQGYAHIDYFPSDLRYVRVLNGISEMRQYQLKEMLKKICAIYQSKHRRNLLISSETFTYLFHANDDIENRTKSGLMLLAKDLDNKFNFPVLIVRPKAMLSKNYVLVPFDIEDAWLKKYGNYAKLQIGSAERTILSQNQKYASDIIYRDTGRTYLVDMASIWENFYPNKSFGLFKQKFFEEEFRIQNRNTRLGLTAHVAPRLRVEIFYEDNYAVVSQKLEAILNVLVEIFQSYKNGEKKQFAQKEFEVNLIARLGEKIISHDKVSLLLDVFSETVDEKAPFTQSRSRVRVLRKRKQVGHDDYVYFVSNSAYDRLTSFFVQHLRQCAPNSEENSFQCFYPLTKDQTIAIMPLLRIMELFGLARYEIRGGEKAEVFIRINDPQKLNRLANGKYVNTVLQAIQGRHRRSTELLTAFFKIQMSDEDRWELIEQYFLGNEQYVSNALGLEC